MKREIEVEARPENLERIRGFVEAACAGAGFAHSAMQDLKLAVDEACSNVVEHGYAGGPPGTIGISLEADDAKISVTIADRGRSFDPAHAPAADVVSDWEKRRIGGLGWHFIRQLVEEIRYESDAEKGNRLTLVKRRPTVARSNPGED